MSPIAAVQIIKQALGDRSNAAKAIALKDDLGLISPNIFKSKFALKPAKLLKLSTAHSMVYSKKLPCRLTFFI